MSPNIGLILQIIGIITGAIAAVLLYVGSLGVPWRMQSYSGETERERRYKIKRRLMVWLGLPCVFISAGCQLAIAIWPPIN